MFIGKSMSISLLHSHTNMVAYTGSKKYQLFLWCVSELVQKAIGVYLAIGRLHSWTASIKIVRMCAT